MKKIAVLFLPALLCSAIDLSAQVKPAAKSNAQANSATNGLADNAVNYEYASNDPLNARIYTLKNGMKVYLSVYKNAPRIQTYIAVKAGSKNDPANATGLAHYLEHMVFKGTDVFGTKDFKKESTEIKKIENLYEKYRQTTNPVDRKKIYHEIDSISGVAAQLAIANEYDKMLAGLGATGTNAYTSFDQTVYVNEIPSNQIDNWLKIEAERFRKPVLRLFHTELEAVYEEKNRGLDSDDNKVWETVFASLFKKHTYGTQTTIGTIEHLKNPSMVEINRYYNKHYVPNNMAIVMSGDFDPDKVIAAIEKNFASYATKPVEKYKTQEESPLTAKISRTVVGPNPASIVMAYRVGGEGSKDADICTLLSGMLNNGTAGLMDINLNQAQKVLNSNNFYYPLKDHGIFAFSAEPKEGQSLEEVEKLLYSQVDLIKKGDFQPWLMEAVVTDLRLRKTKELEKNSSRADALLNAFVNEQKWQYNVNMLDRLSKISKQELMFFANKTFNDHNYAVVYKRTGTDSTIVKVEKPAITPVEVDRDNSSQFVKDIQKNTPDPIAPKFLDYDKDIVRSTFESLPLLYNKNTENKLFELYYKFDMGSINNKKLPIAIKYIPYLSTSGMTAAQVKEELYKLGCSFNVFSDNENTWVSLSGLADNFEKAATLFEKLLSKPVVEESVLKSLIADLQKERADSKLQKRLILNKAMSNYARYGAVNPFSYVLTNEELDKISANEIREIIQSLSGFQHKILFYGPQELEKVKEGLTAFHTLPSLLKPVPVPMKFEERKMDQSVYVVDYDMKQAEIVMLSNGDNYRPDQVPVITLYNNYFGGGMSSILFQDLRESKALAYSTFSRYNQPNKLGKTYFNFSYIGSQADKLEEALKGLSDLLNEMPKAEGSFSSARELILQEMCSQRITKADVIFNYLDAEQLGLSADIRRDIYEKVQKCSFEDIATFHKNNIKGKPVTTLVLGKKENLNTKILEKYGPVKYLSLTEIFGY